MKPGPPRQAEARAPRLTRGPRPARLCPRRVSGRWLLLLLDVAVVAWASAGAPWWGTLTVVTGLVGALAAAGLYRPRLSLSALDDLSWVGLGVGGAWAGTIGLASAVPVTGSALRWPGWWWLGVGAALAVVRLVGYRALRRWRRARPQPAVVLGLGKVSVRVAEAFLAHPECGLAPVGFVGSHDHRAQTTLPLPVLGPLKVLPDVVRDRGVAHLVVAFGGPPDNCLVEVLRRCRQQGCSVSLVPRLFEMDVSCLGAELVAGVPIVRMREQAEQRWEWRVKRLLDVLVAAVGLVLLSPLLLACAAAVRSEVGRAGVFFRQERIGPDGGSFEIVKFRSLVPTSDLESDVRWDVDGDGRIGPVGRLLRRTCLDELPQLVNVLRGEMSLVGPRPERPYFVAKFGDQHRHYVHRHRLPGGMTGWAQIHGLRGDTSVADRVDFDNFYIENWSLGLDLKILIRTVPAVLARRRRMPVSAPPDRAPEPAP
jgi:exopolysaccharide biosynthesis polyprenyl glycosylphosphotransferase